MFAMPDHSTADDKQLGC